MANPKKNRVEINSLHVDDFVYFRNRRMVVVSINRDDGRIFVRGRKHSCSNCDMQWVDVGELTTRPRSMATRRIQTIHEVDSDDAEAIVWEPDRKPVGPTIAGPGSELKIEVFRMRVARGEILFHPLDFNSRGMNLD